MAQETKHIYEFGPFRLDASERMLWQGDALVPLTPKVLETLVVLVEAGGRLVEKAELMNKVWPDTAVEEGNLTFNVSLLRKALGDDRQNGNRYIETVPRRGYRFIAAATVQEPQSPVTIQPDVVAKRRPATPALIVGGAALLAVAALALWLSLWRSQPRVLSSSKLTADFREKSGRLLTDATYIYFTGSEGDATVLRFISVQGGQPGTISTPIRLLELADINPNRAEILAIGSRPGSVESRPWVIALPSGSARLAMDTDVDAACWSPDGARMAYSRGTNLYVADRDGATPVKLAALRGLVEDLRWSPDGKVLRFFVHESRSESRDLWEIEPSGQHLHPLLAGRANPIRGRHSCWSADGTWFVFVSERDGNRDLFALNDRVGLFRMPGRDPFKLTRQLASFLHPAASRDGKKLFAIGEQVIGRLVRYDAARGEFGDFLGGIWADSVAFSRDGQWVAYRAWPDSILWRARVDGTRQLQLTFPPWKADGASWSPDCKRIAIRLRKPGKPYKIYIMAADGGEPQELLPADLQEEGLPTWSADGKQLAFGEVPANFAHPSGKETIHICDLDPRKERVLPESGGLWSSRWSPDGRYISALTADPRQRLMLYDSAHGWRDLGADYVNSPTWSHDSQYIYCGRLTAGGAPAILRVRVSDGKREQVVSLEGQKVNSAGWSGLAPDNSPIVVQDRGISEIYALDVEWP